MKTRFPALRTVGTIFKVLAILIALITFAVTFFAPNLVGGILGLGRSLGLIGMGIRLVVLLYGGGSALIMYAIGESLSVLLAMEENTRETAMLLQGTQSYASPSRAIETGERLRS